MSFALVSDDFALLWQIEEERWYDTVDSNGYKRRKAVTQYHDLIGFSLGPFGKRLAQLCVAISLFGTGIAQIIASSSSQYTISPQINKRCHISQTILIRTCKCSLAELPEVFL